MTSATSNSRRAIGSDQRGANGAFELDIVDEAGLELLVVAETEVEEVAFPAFQFLPLLAPENAGNCEAADTC